MKLRKNNVYTVRITKAREIADDLELFISDLPSRRILQKECCQRAYLAGAFLATGSVNHPSTSNYHLEMSVEDEDLACYLRDLLNTFHLNAKLIKRRNREVVYLKSAEKIADFLRIVGAPKSLMDFENERIDRDFSNNINRWDNCVIANEMKSVQAGQSQIADIALIIEKYGIDHFDEKSQEIVQLRLTYPDVSLAELASLYQEATGQPISKSGINHRLKKIKDEANTLRRLGKEG